MKTFKRRNYLFSDALGYSKPQLQLFVYVWTHAVVWPKIGQASAIVMSPNPSM